MFARIVSYQRYKDLYSWKCLEVKFSLVFTIVFYIFFLNILDLYEKMSLYIQDLKDSILCIIAGDFGLLGVNLAGMAIITSLFTPEIMEIIKRVDKKDTINKERGPWYAVDGWSSRPGAARRGVRWIFENGPNGSFRDICCMRRRPAGRRGRISLPTVRSQARAQGGVAPPCPNTGRRWSRPWPPGRSCAWR